MKCPNCGSENCHFVSNTETHEKGFNAGNACCGYILGGPIGLLLCGLCGSEKRTKTREYWICNSCGNSFSQSEGEEVMRREALRIKKIRFYCEVQAESKVETFYTDLGEKIKKGIDLFLRDNFPKEELIISNPIIENEVLEGIKYTLGQVLTEKDIVYLALLTNTKFLISEKGMIINNLAYSKLSNFYCYKNEVYFGQNCILTASEIQAKKLCHFFEYIYNDSMCINEYDNYIELLKVIQNLPDENASRLEHYSSQLMYAEYIKNLKEEVFKKFQETSLESYQKYTRAKIDYEEYDHRGTKYDLWALYAAGIVFIFSLMESGFGKALLSGVLTFLPTAIYVGITSHNKKKEMLGFLPDYYKKVQLEDELEPIQKKGNIKVADYEKILNS